MSKNHYIIPIFVPHEGCPHNCVFCNQNTITGSKTNVDSSFVHSTVLDYLKTINNKKATKEISFFGGSFTAIDIKKQNELLEVAKFYKDKGDVDFIRLSTRPDAIDEFILNNLKNYSVDIIELGVQSMDKDVLLKSGRGHSSEDVVKASKLIKQYGFTLGHQIMLGLPTDNFTKDIETTKKLIELNPDICRIYPALVIKNTPMEEMVSRGIYKPYNLNDAVEISKTIYGMLVSKGIQVIRIGLQPTDTINLNAEIVCGPFHPAFRELVEASIYKDIILSVVPDNTKKDIVLQINNKDISKLYADKKRFFLDMKKQLQTSNFKVIQCNSIKQGEFKLKIGENIMNMSINKYLSSKY